jgi:hypothetical protein
MLDSRGSTITAPRASFPVKTMLKELTEEIEYGLERVSAAVKRGELKLDGDKVKVRWLAAQRTPPELKEVRRDLYRAYLRSSSPTSSWRSTPRRISVRKSLGDPRKTKPSCCIFTPGL